jgi:hypothetical protein
LLVDFSVTGKTDDLVFITNEFGDLVFNSYFGRE